MHSSADSVRGREREMTRFSHPTMSDDVWQKSDQISRSGGKQGFVHYPERSLKPRERLVNQE